jgi:hypothetical protein
LKFAVFSKDIPEFILIDAVFSIKFYYCICSIILVVTRAAPSLRLAILEKICTTAGAGIA